MTMNLKSLLISFSIFALFYSCKGTHKGQILQEKPFFVKNNYALNLNTSTSDSIEFYYSGCSGFYIKYQNEGIMTDVFLSNIGPVAEVAVKKLKSDTALIDGYFQKILRTNTDKNGGIKALLATHTHYDHVLDFPYIYQRKLNPDSLIIVGSAGVKNLLIASETHYGKKINQKNIISIDSSNASDAINLRKWVYSKNKKFRMLPIISEHAPHFYGIKLYKGSIEKNIKDIPTKAGDYKEGQSLSYLIDVLGENQKVVFRIFIQGSSSTPPMGFPPTEVLKEKPVDVAILCVASFQYVHQYPEGIVNKLKPKLLILSHWENFFQPHKTLEKTVLTVPFTNINLFLERLDCELKKQDIKSKYIMPNIFTSMKVKF